MPLSYFPPLPETIWGNLSGNIELQSDLIELINKNNSTIINRKNLIINPNFRIWQRCANQLNIVSRTRSSNIVTLETDKVHCYLSGDTVQITSMSDDSYDQPTAGVVTVIDENHFSYSNNGADESDTTETSGLALLLNRKSIVATDGDFVADRWIALTDNTDINAIADDNGMKLVTKTSSKFGILQIIPSEYLEAYISSTFSLSIELNSTENSLAKIALLSWLGNKDNTTNDAISSWNAEGTDPTLSANWHYEAISEELTLSAELQIISLENQIIQTSGAKNIALFLWFEEITNGEIITVNNSQMTNTANLIDFVPSDYASDLELCRRFYQKSYSHNKAPNQITEQGKKIFPTSYGAGNGSSFGTIQISNMYKEPTVELIAASNPPISGKWQVSTGANIDVSAIDINESSYSVENNAGFTISTTNVSGHFVCSAEI